MSPPFFFFFLYLNFIIIQTKNLYGINNKSNGVGIVRMSTCVTIKLQMNPVHLLQFLPNLRNWTSLNQLFQAQLASSKRMEICQTLLFTNKLWKEHNFEYGSRAKLFTIWSIQINTHSRFMGNGSRYVHTHYAIAFIANSIPVFSHWSLKWTIRL